MSDLLPRLQLLARLQESATAWASRARRNGQQLAMYADRCTEIVRDLDQSLRMERSPADEEYLQDLMAVSRLEVIMLTLHPTIVDEVGGSGPTPESCESWERNQPNIEQALRDLHREPFRASQEPWQEDLDSAVNFDEWTWITRLLNSTNAGSSELIEGQISLVREIYSLETEFWARDGDVRKAAISALMNVVSSASEAGSQSQLIVVLKEILDLLRNPNLNPVQLPASEPSVLLDQMGGTPTGSEEGRTMDSEQAQTSKLDLLISAWSGDGDSETPTLSQTVHDSLPLREPAIFQEDGFSDHKHSHPDLSIVDGNILSADEELKAHITFDSTEPFDSRDHFSDHYLGTHQKMGKVALKRLRRFGRTIEDEAALELDFARETKFWTGFQHHYILPCLGSFTLKGHRYLVSPFMKNGALSEWIKLDTPGLDRLRLARKIIIVQIFELSDALAYVHSKGLVHGDVKARNVLLSDDLQVQLCNFGLTQPTEASTSSRLKGAGSFRWQSPELWSYGSKTFKSDVYAFSMTILEVLTGQIPFSDLNSDAAIMEMVVMKNERPPKEPGASSDGTSYAVAWDIAERGWLSNPSDRISMDEAAKILSVWERS